VRFTLALLVSLSGCVIADDVAVDEAGEVSVDAAVADDDVTDDPVAEAEPAAGHPCASRPAVCPTARAAEGRGLVAIDRCAFPIDASSAFSTAPRLIAALERIATRVSVADVLRDLNRTAARTTRVAGGPPGVVFGLRWQPDDDTIEHWIPQGVTGSADANDTGLVDGKRVFLSSWYNRPPAGTASKGVRIAFLDPAAAKYRFALLVVPKGAEATPSFAPLDLHAGGIVWFRDMLYVADTSRGFRVFDLRHILRVAVDRDEMGCAAGTCRAGQYRYVIPQVGSYLTRSTCGMRFSFASLDRGSGAPALISGEYCTDGTCATPLSGRLYRWRLDPATGLLEATRSWPTKAFLMGHRQVQGAAARSDIYYLSSSSPAGRRGVLHRVTTGRSATSRWNDNAEAVMIDRASDQLVSQSEHSPRVLFGVRRSAYPPP
jgi:hypothetical protein